MNQAEHHPGPVAPTTSNRPLPPDPVERLLRLGSTLAHAELTAGAARPDGLRLTRAQLGSVATSLLVRDRSEAEWVLHWPVGAQAAAWRWPQDPELPVLRRTDAVHTLLVDPGWEPAVPAGALGAVDRVGYRPGRRATFRVEKGSRSYLLKLACAADRPGLLRAGRVAAAMPAWAQRAVAHHPGWGASLFEFLPGLPLDRLAPDARGAPLVALPELLVALHGTDAADLPPWDADQPIRKLEALTAAVAPTASDVAAVARPVTERIAARLAVRRGRGVVIHGDLSLRNLVWDASVPPGLPALGVIDWDSAAIGPREADLSPLVGLLGPAAGDLVAAYERAGGHPLNRDLLDALVLANRLVRTLRHTASGRITPVQARERAVAIGAALDPTPTPGTANRVIFGQPGTA